MMNSMNSTQGSLFDCSTSSFFHNNSTSTTTFNNGAGAADRSFNGFRQAENSEGFCTPHFFGATLKSPKQIKRDHHNASQMYMDDSNVSRSFLGHNNSSINRSSTFAVRSSKENRFNPYPPIVDKERLPNNGPPLRSLRNFQPPLKRIVQIEEDAEPANPLPSPEERDYWVTVFGFEMEDMESIVELFGRHGQILKTARPTNGEGNNWIHLRYASKTHVDQALQRNGHVVGKKFIGVAQSPHVNYGYESKEWELSTPVIHPAVEQSPEETITRRDSIRRLNGMRPLAHAVPPPTTQSKGSGIFSYLFKGGKK